MRDVANRLESQERCTGFLRLGAVLMGNDETERQDALKRALEETSFLTEDIMQALLAEYPDLLLGDQIKPENPRRWLLVAREMAVPSDIGEEVRWSLDHLFLDQDGVPTFLECKRAADTRARREVVAQMLDYAANGLEYWNIERLREAAAKTARKRGKSLDDEVTRLLGRKPDGRKFWGNVENNLRDQRIRLVFVMDYVPKELGQLVEFLDKTMPLVEVLAVEVKQFQGKVGNDQKEKTKGDAPRSLSALEAKLILHLEGKRQSVVTTQQVMDILGCSYDHARQILHRLSRDRWLARIKAGKYELIPAERGEHATIDTNPLFIGSTLVSPYYFSFATAAFFHGLSTQASAIVYIATSTGKPQQLIVRDKEYRLVVQPAHKFFGAVEVDAYGSRVMMAEPEKTIVDCLDKAPYAGGIPEIATMLWRSKGHLNWNRLYTHASRFKSQSLTQRLGYLADVLELPLEMSVRDALLARIGKSTCYLGQPIQWKKGGEYNATWHIVDNIPRQVLLGDIEVY